MTVGVCHPDWFTVTEDFVTQTDSVWQTDTLSHRMMYCERLCHTQTYVVGQTLSQRQMLYNSRILLSRLTDRQTLLCDRQTLSQRQWDNETDRLCHTDWCNIKHKIMLCDRQTLSQRQILCKRRTLLKRLMLWDQ